MINHIFISSLCGILDVESISVTQPISVVHVLTSYFDLQQWKMIVDKTGAYISPASGLSLVYVSLYLGIVKNYTLQGG